MGGLDLERAMQGGGGSPLDGAKLVAPGDPASANEPRRRQEGGAQMEEA